MILAALLLAGASPPAAPPPPAQPPHSAECARAATGADGFCTATDGTRLHYVDWGGSGPAIVLLTGLGNSARIYDDLAPMLAHGHRVIAITRRGYGLSSDAPAADYGNARLVRDVLDVMDGLGITRAAFVGHSLAGGELAALGADHADRATHLIYLDAAYDRSLVPGLMADLPPMPSPTADDLASLAAFTAWREGALGVRSAAVASDIEDIMVARPGGIAPRTAEKVAGAILAGDIAAPPRYAAIAMPSLALYASKDVAEQVPANAPAKARRALRDYSVRHFRPWMLAAKARFTKEQRCGTAFEIPRSGHYLFLERPAWTARVVQAFLTDPSPCDFRVPDPGRARKGG